MTSGCADAGAGCFIPETVLPKREAVMTRVDNGQAGRDLMAAVFDGDTATVGAMLARDPRLRNTQGGVLGDLLSVAIARCDKPMLTRLLASGVPADGPPANEPPLTLALRVTEPWFAETLLKAGASANRLTKAGGRPLDDAIVIGSAGAVRMLIEYGAKLDDRSSTGATPLQTALDGHRFAIAELLIARGADPWAVDNSGGNLGWAVSRPSLAQTAEDDAAHARLAAKLPAMGWPSPAPSPKEVRALVAAGRWPPARARN
ncbi:ankyrin repeat domain-containing protein [Glacieibacterium frigidum]|uniref:Ankyrin repeat domain-containing protein n=2 Tax=Glacieibacterium frigidum TaxID=2593303 RepID=A0A552UGN2_9SPHN|nr:ankyrin repeat domain-containing protein [Glacieibacterium frigidum]